MSEAKREKETEKQEESAEKLVKKVKRAERGVKLYQTFILRLAALLLVLWVLFFQIVGLTHMPNGDMSPRMDAGDLVLFYRLDKDVRAQDVIVINKVTPDSDGKKELYICRVVAVKGETVEIAEGNVFRVNGNTQIENNIYSATAPYDGYTEFPLTLGEDECFVLADHRNGGADSRYFGPVSKSEILGTVITILRRNNM